MGSATKPPTAAVINALERAIIDKHLLRVGANRLAPGARRIEWRNSEGGGFLTQLVADDFIDVGELEDGIHCDYWGEVEGVAAGFLVYVKKGVLDAVEGFPYVDTWPSSSRDFVILDEPPDLSGA